jgi:hypothetical protein
LFPLNISGSKCIQIYLENPIWWKFSGKIPAAEEEQITSWLRRILKR